MHPILPCLRRTAYYARIPRCSHAGWAGYELSEYSKTEVDRAQYAHGVSTTSTLTELATVPPLKRLFMSGVRLERREPGKPPMRREFCTLRLVNEDGVTVGQVLDAMFAYARHYNLNQYGLEAWKALFQAEIVQGLRGPVLTYTVEYLYDIDRMITI